MFGFLKKKQDRPRQKIKKVEPRPITRNPLIVGLNLYKLKNLDQHPEEEPIVKTVGQGKVLEDQGKFEQAIAEYEKAEELTYKICADEIAELKREFPSRPDDWDWLYLQMIRRRIRVCRKALEKRDGGCKK